MKEKTEKKHIMAMGSRRKRLPSETERPAERETRWPPVCGVFDIIETSIGMKTESFISLSLSLLVLFILSFCSYCGN